MENINILIASDSFKGSLSSIDVANCMKRGFIKTGYNVNVRKVPIADGGEGTVESVTKALNGEIREYIVDDIFRKPTKAILGILDKDTVILETASPLGLDKLKNSKLNPLTASSYGLGQMLLNALDLNPKKIYIGLGGSAVNDGGIGLAEALGAKLLDTNGEIVKDGAVGLKDLSVIEIGNLDTRLKEVEIILLSDVSNLLTGNDGATYVYGPQKGVRKEQIEQIDFWMNRYGKLLEKTFNNDVLNTPGAGAAGGLGAALMSFSGAKISNGIEKILELIRIEDIIINSDLVFTGEGKMDNQSKYGKAPIGIAKLAKKYNLPVIAIVGSFDKSAIDITDIGIDLVLDIINEPMTLEAAIENASELIEITSYMALNYYLKCKKF